MLRNFQGYTALLLATLILPKNALSGETINLPTIFGDEAGCYFYKHYEVKTDDGTYIANDLMWSYEELCSFINVTNVTKSFSASNIKNAWSAKLICEAEGEPSSYEALIIHNDGDAGTENVTVKSEGRGKDSVLSPCK